MERETVTENMFVADVLERWPETAAIFQQFKTACVGCAMAPFDTVADAVRIYELNGPAFLRALRRAAEDNTPQLTETE